MRAPAFWWRDEPSPIARLLTPVGRLIGAGTARRMAAAGTRVSVPVICVGNPVAGGAGKTPTAIAIARRLMEHGQRPAFVTRGYGGRLTGPLRVDTMTHDHGAVGDEPLLLARVAATYLARDRVAGAALAIAGGARVIVMDDGFQNPSLVKDIALLVVDGAAGIGNGLCLPAGPLRAPLDAQLACCDAVVVVGEGQGGQGVTARAHRLGKPVLSARLVPDEAVAGTLRGRSVIAFAGIGRPSKFAATLRDIGAEVLHLHALGDHAAPDTGQARTILRQAAQTGAVIVATEKDVVKLGGNPALRDLRDATLAVPVRLAFDAPEALDALLCAASSGRPG